MVEHFKFTLLQQIEVTVVLIANKKIINFYPSFET